jgi:hypothetical protein
MTIKGTEALGMMLRPIKHALIAATVRDRMFWIVSVVCSRAGTILLERLQR